VTVKTDNEEVDVFDLVGTADAEDVRVEAGKRRWWTPLQRRWFPLTLAFALVLSAALAGWLYFAQYRPDRATDQAVQQTVLKAATDGTVALLSYKPDSLDHDFTTAKSHLTGDFLSYYNKFTQEIVTPAAKQKAVSTSAAVVRSAVMEMHPDSAVVMVFVNQATTSNQNPDGSFAASTVKVGLTKVDGSWLISSFDPV
jgi:Mce-associated membrane protein